MSLASFVGRLAAVLLVLPASTALAQRAPSPAQLAHLDSLWARRAPFALRRALAGVRPGTAPFHEGTVAALFRDDSVALVRLGAFLATAAAVDPRRADAHELLASLESRRGRYAAAAAHVDSALAVVPAADSARRDELRRGRATWHALGDVPPQRVAQVDRTPVPVVPDRAGLLTIAVRAGDAADSAAVPMVLDTGAGLTVVTAGTAARLGARVGTDSVEVGSVTGARVRAALGVVPSLAIGGTRVDDVVVLVFRDEDLSFPQAGYAIRGIIGYPVLAALGRMRIDGGRLLVVEGAVRDAVPLTARNVAADGHAPLVAVHVRGIEGTWLLDTGSQSSFGLPRLLARHEPWVRRAGTPMSGGLGGAGGTTTVTGFTLPGVRLAVGGRDVDLARFDVHARATNARAARLEGVLGVDLFAAGRTVLLDLGRGVLRVQEEASR